MMTHRIKKYFQKHLIFNPQCSNM